MPTDGRLASLRLYVSLFVGAILAAFALLFFFIFHTTMPQMLLEAENKYLGQQLRLTDGMLASARETLLLLTEDTAAWEEGALFVEGKNPNFIANNWPEKSILESFRLNFIFVKDLQGNDLHADFRSTATNQRAPIPPGLSEYCAGFARTVADTYTPEHGDNKTEFGKEGFLFFDGAAYNVAIMPIVPSREAEKPSGVLIMGNLLDNNYFLHLTHYEGDTFSIREDTDVSPNGNNGFKDIQHLDENTVSTTTRLMTLDGKILALVMTEQRRMFTTGKQQIILANILMAAAMALFGIALYFGIGRLVVRPIARLSADIQALEKSDEAGSTAIATDKYSRSREFAVLCASINNVLAKLGQSKISLSMLHGLLDGIDAYLYVVDPEDDTILYINEKMRRHYGLAENPIGTVCWQTLQDGLTERCPFCPYDQLVNAPDTSIVWEERSSLTGRQYRNTDCLIEWEGGKLVHLQHSVDITSIKTVEASLQKRLEQQELMAEMARSFIATDGVDTLINNALRMAGEFMGVSKIILARCYLEENLLNAEFEWYSKDHCWERPETTRLPFLPGTQEYNGFVIAKLPYIALNDISEMEEYAVPYSQGIRSLAGVPVYVFGELWGMLSFGMCGKVRIWSESDIQLTTLIGTIISGVVERNTRDAELVRAKEQAEQSNMAKSEFLSRMSHEMRTPLNAIIGMTSIATAAPSVEKKQYCLDKIDEASTHLLGVINDILDMSKIEANKFELSYTEFSFDRMLSRVLNVVNFRIDEKEQHLVVNVAPDIPYSIISDDQRLAQVIANLLSNAVKFTPEQGTITLTAAKLDEQDGECTLRIAVQDTGIGISAENQARLFNSFEQADGGISRKFGGTGLGLAISKRIVNLMGGEIQVESEPGHGAVFSFTIKAQRGTATSESAIKDIDWTALRILAVDDAPEVGEYFRNLAHTLGFTCTTAESAFEAWDILEKNGCKAFDIIFADWKMPGMDGIELAAKVRDCAAEPPVVVMISASEWSDLETQARAVGIQKFVPKPLFSAAIIDAVGEILGRAATDQGEALDTASCFSEFTILLAEDIDINREIVITMLEDTGITIDCAENGAIAADMFRENPDRYAMIFMDIHMPEVDGYEATRRIRAMDGIPRARTVPIIAMTANVFREDIERCLAAGMNGHIGKPINFEALFEKLREGCRKS